LTKVHGQVRRSTAHEKARRKSIDTAAPSAPSRMQARIKALQAKIDALITEQPALNEYKSQIRIDVTPDGLQIQIVDDQNRPMFDSGSALVKPYMRDILREIGAAWGRGKPHQPGRPHRRRALRQQRPRLQQLGAVGRPRQRLAPRAGGRRHARRQAGRVVTGWRPATCWSRRTRAPDQPAHHHHW
jgi:hypothetical protein